MCLKNYLRILPYLHNLNYSTKAKFKLESINSREWQREVALIIYRQPIIAPPMSEAERKFAELSEEFDKTNSYKCDFELRMEKDAILLAKRKQFEAEGRDLSELDQELGINTFELCNQWKEKAQKLTNKFNLDKSTTDNNVTDYRTIGRNLDRKLLLIVRQKFADSKDDSYVSPWTLPVRKNENDETLRQSVEKCLRNIFEKLDESNYSLKILGNAPIAHYMNLFSKSMQEHIGVLGSIVFFYPIQIIPKRLSRSENSTLIFNEDMIVDYKWYNIDEINNQMKWKKKFKTSINAVLVE